MKVKNGFILAAAVLVMGVLPLAASAEGIPSRSEISDIYKWKTSDIFKSDTAWEQEFTRAKEYISGIGTYKGQLGKSAASLLQAFKADEKMWRSIENLYVYANLKVDEDGGVSLYQGMAERVESLNTDAASAESYMLPEILEIPRETIDKWVKENGELQAYQHYIDTLFRNKAHTLSPQEEEILARVGDLASSPEDIYNTFKTNDLKFPSIKDANGNDMPMSDSRLSVALQNPDRRIRMDAMKTVYGEYGKYSNTLAATLSAQVKKDIFFSRVRKYDSSLESALDSSAIPSSVYNNLINAVNANLEPLHKYVSLRKEILGLDAVHQYDMYVNLVKNADIKYSYEEAKALALKALAPLGSQYLSDFEAGLNGGWIDVYENQNKRSGAYSWGTYESHPFVLMNFTDDLDSVSTLVHEMGHSLHNQYSKSQPYVYSSYGSFLAEIASTTNEMLLNEYLLKVTADKDKRLYILNEMIENIRGSIYTQVMYSEFEKVIHERAEAGESLTAKDLTGIWKALMTKYFGPDFVVDDEATYWWSRIPHFYMDFYVYKYATGMSAAVAFAQKVQEGGTPAAEKYLGFLKAGSSKYPIEILNDAGLDMSSPEPIEKSLKLFESLVDEMSKLLAQ